MLPASKHFDVVCGVDAHVVITPAGVPIVMAVIFTGFLFDPIDWTWSDTDVRINGLPRAVAGTAAVAMPRHIPYGGVFAKPPSNDGQLFMGSSTVSANGKAQGYAALPVLTCHDIGMPAPERAGGSRARGPSYLPTSITLPIPHDAMVYVGGTPTITVGGVQKVLVKPLLENAGGTLRKTARGAS